MIASLGMTAAVILAMAFVIPTAFTWVDVRVTRGWPYIVGGVSALSGLMGWLLVVVSPATGATQFSTDQIDADEMLLKQQCGTFEHNPALI